VSAFQTASATIRLGDALEEFDQRLGDRAEPEVLTLTEKRGFMAQRERFHKRLAIADTSDYKLIGLHDIAFNPYLLWASAVAQNTAWSQAIISPLYPTFHLRNGYDPRFINYVLHSSSVRSLYDSISFGSVPRKRRASVHDFLNLRIPAPPALPEQRRIAAVLDRAEALKLRRQTTLEELDNLGRSLFLELFGDPVVNPKGWPLLAIAEIGTVITGNSPSRAHPEYFGNSIEWIKSDNINTPGAKRAEELHTRVGWGRQPNFNQLRPPVRGVPYCFQSLTP
jgi:type I restriction enzyme, S subunit